MPKHENEFSELQTRGLSVRSLSLRSDSINLENRSFEAVVATETVAQVMDYSRYEVIDEILVAAGGDFPNQVPLLPNHSRYSVLDVIGSAREFRREGNQWIGRGYLASPVGENDDVERIWGRVAEGHLRAVSIGYTVAGFVDIPRGGKQQINGRSYEAVDRTLRITTKWKVRELSLTPIGADSAALIRCSLGLEARNIRSFFAR